jgi:hypothetical protein
MDLRQLLVRQGGAEVRVASANDLERLPAQLTRQPAIARPAATLRDQPAWAVLRVGALQATHLAGR